ncbi:hypothetical protein ZOSMA_24G01330 [Zostera marina]|uniref:Uncharacterized protein n=1 Tax=Zostera marina TaxID=29655 RepID=A0A0K9PIR3_ZOSMR|nr:hypothetical protein ZOSMA_24G01330 [Zostera marina]
MKIGFAKGIRLTNSRFDLVPKFQISALRIFFILAISSEMNLMTKELEQVPSESPIPDQSGLQSQATSVVVELLDDYWFFRNCLRHNHTTPPNKSKDEVSKVKCNSSSVSVKKEKVGAAEQGKVATGAKIRKVLRVCSYDSMDKFVLSSHLNLQQSSGNIDSRRRNKELKNYFPQNKGMKAQKSVADLEHEEVRGFEDLGFVFDKERLSPVLLKMIPGLSREGSGSDCGGGSDRKVATRPYLSESWIVQRSTPSVVNWVGRKLAPDVKEQLQLWAKSVACNKTCV